MKLATADNHAVGHTFTVPRPAVFQFAAFGTWNGATASLEWSPDQTNWLSLVDAGNSAIALTADGVVTNIPIPEGHVRMTLASIGGSTSITAYLDFVA